MGRSCGRALKRNARSGGYKRLGVGVEAKQPILAPRSHAAGRQGAARTPPAVRGATDEHSRQRSASAETTRTLAQEQESIRDLVKCGQTSINSTLARRQFRRDRPSLRPNPGQSARGRNPGSILLSEQASRDFHKPSGFTTGKDSPRRPGRRPVPPEPFRKENIAFDTPFRIGRRADFVDRIVVPRCQP
jgi:hypothetical protein